MHANQFDKSVDGLHPISGRNSANVLLAVATLSAFVLVPACGTGNSSAAQTNQSQTGGNTSGGSTSGSNSTSQAPALTKPAARSQINPAQPLAAGLVSLVTLCEGSGSDFYDSATNQTYKATVLSGTPVGAKPPAWFTPTKGPDYPWSGPAIQNNGAKASAIESNVQPSMFIAAPTTGYSYAMLVQPLDTTTFGRVLDATGAAVVTMYLNIPGRPGTVSTTWRNAAGTAINPAYAFTANKWVLVLCTVKQGLGVMYVNGVQVAQDTTVDLTQSIANQAGTLSFNTTGNGSAMPNASFSSWWIWSNRFLTPKEAASMYVDPWSMLR